MSRDSERGIGYLVGHEEPETKARRVAELKRQFESSAPMPLSNPMDVFTSLPLATEVKLGSNTKALAPSVTTPVKTQKKKPTNRQIYNGAMRWITKKDEIDKLNKQQLLDRRIDGAKVLQYVSDNNTMYADQPRSYWQWDGVKQDYVDINKGKTKKPIHQQLSDLKNWEQKNKEKSLSKIVKPPIGDMKIINTNQKDIANKQPRKKYESL